MKKIINGKVYDTDTAKKCGEWYSSRPKNDFSYYEEDLYQKKTGEYFLYGNGNAASKYSRSCGQNEWCGGESIIPLTYDGAQEWAEEHLDVEDYINLFFSELEEDDSKTRLNLYVPTSVAASLKNEAAKRNISIGDFIIILLNEHFS